MAERLQNRRVLIGGAVAVVGLLGLCLCCGLLGVVGGSRSDRVAAATGDGRRATAATEAPVAWPILPVSAEAQAYLLAGDEQVGVLGEAMGSLGKLLQNPQIGNNAWTLQATTQVALVRKAHAEIEKLSPPPELAEFHLARLDATGDCQAATDALTTGIDNFDIEAIQQGGELAGSCGKKLRGMPARLAGEE
jgi:hypothetical protein